MLLVWGVTEELIGLKDMHAGGDATGTAGRARGGGGARGYNGDESDYAADDGIEEEEEVRLGFGLGFELLLGSSFGFARLIGVCVCMCVCFVTHLSVHAKVACKLCSAIQRVLTKWPAVWYTAIRRVFAERPTIWYTGSSSDVMIVGYVIGKVRMLLRFLTLDERSIDVCHYAFHGMCTIAATVIFPILRENRALVRYDDISNLFPEVSQLLGLHERTHVSSLCSTRCSARKRTAVR